MSESPMPSPPMPVIPLHGAAEAIHIGENDLPFVDLGDGTHLQVLQVDLTQGLWIVKTRFEPGFAISTHYHTGPVFAVTLSGSWFYKEYPDSVNTRGSYLFEPAGSVHTLTVSTDQTELTEVWFAVYGANVNIDEEGNVTSLVTASLVLESYRALCAAIGHENPKVIVIGEEQAGAKT
jgi:2,4'-dihydroxyacetophenone dioxygenase